MANCSNSTIGLYGVLLLILTQFESGVAFLTHPVCIYAFSCVLMIVRKQRQPRVADTLLCSTTTTNPQSVPIT